MRRSRHQDIKGPSSVDDVSCDMETLPRTTILVFFDDGENVERLAVTDTMAVFFLETQWNQTIRIIMLEEDTIFKGDSIRYIDGRMKELYLIQR